MDELNRTLNIINTSETYKDDNTIMYYEELFDNNDACMFSPNSDIINIKYIVFDLLDYGIPILLSDIKEKIYLSSLICAINEKVIYNIPLKLLLELSSPRILNNKLYILVPSYLFNGCVFHNSTNSNIILRLLRVNEIKNVIIRASLIVQKRMNDTGEQINDNPKEIYNNTSYQLLKEIIIQPQTYSDFVIHEIDIRGYVKGVFICVDIYELMEIKLYLDFQIYLHYDYHSINLHCKKISRNLIFLPFTSLSNYATDSENSFTNALNFNNINSKSLSLRFHKKQKSAILYFLVKYSI